MKMKIVIATILLFNIAFNSLGGEPVPDWNFVERKKTVVKLFDVRPGEKLSIDNRHGDVQVLLWNKPSIRIDITITANAPTEARVNEVLNSVSIIEKQSVDQIEVRTAISAAGARIQWPGRRGENSLRIDYKIQMPENTPLQLKNSFGDTEIAKFMAPLVVETQYGTFRANDLDNGDNTIIVQFGSAQIGQMRSGKLESRYSEVKLDKVKVLELINKFGSLQIGEVASLNADIGYAGTKIGTLKESGVVKLNFANGFFINQSTAENIDIQASYSSVVLPAQAPAKFDVSVTYGNFQYPAKAPVTFIRQPGPSRTKQYEGLIGHDDPRSTIRVISKYGNVKLKE